VQYGKNTKVGRPAIQALRGSLHSGERGMIITTGRFTEGAVEESRRQGVQAITLMDGHKLIEQMVNHDLDWLT
jgi:restriction endonuclease Mrr